MKLCRDPTLHKPQKIKQPTWLITTRAGPEKHLYLGPQLLIAKIKDVFY